MEVHAVDSADYTVPGGRLGRPQVRDFATYNVAIWGAQLAPHLQLLASSQRNTSGKSKPILVVVSIQAKYAIVSCQKTLKISVGSGVLTNTPLLTFPAMT